MTMIVRVGASALAAGSLLVTGLPAATAETAPATDGTVYVTAIGGRSALWTFGCSVHYSIDERTRTEFGTDLPVALGRITEASNVAFVEAPAGSTSVNVTITTADNPGTGVEGDGSPPVQSGPLGGTGAEVHLFSDGSQPNPDYNFGSRGISLVMHEVGHVLGLGHNPNEDSIMYPVMTREGVWIPASETDRYVEDGYSVTVGTGEPVVFARRKASPFNTTWNVDDRAALAWIRDKNACVSPGVSSKPGAEVTPTVPSASPRCTSARAALARARKADAPARKIAVLRKRVAAACSR